MSRYQIFNINLLHRYFTLLTKRLSEKQLMMIIAFIVGIVGSIAANLFEVAVNGLRNWLTGFEAVDSVNYIYLITPFIGIVLVSLFIKYFIKENISHGVTKILYAITHKGSKLSGHNTYSSIVAGATTIGFGGSVGPEAPIVMTGAAVGSNIGKLFRMNYRNTTILLGCGAAAALAGIFKAPITGVIFVIEVLMLDISLLSIIPILIAAVTSTTITYFLHGFSPIFNVNPSLMLIEVGHMPFYLVLACACGLVAYYIIYSSAKIESAFKSLKKRYLKWVFGGISIGALIFLLPPLYGQGYNSITNLINNDISSLFNNTLFYSMKDNTWVLLAFLAAIIGLKSVAMACTNGAGGVGGAFAPSLFLGAFTGFFVATFLNTVFGLNLPTVSFVLVGMAGVMSGAMDSPLTAVFLIAEITGGYILFVPLMLVSAIAFAISYYFGPYSVYTRELALKGDTMSYSKDRSMLFIELDKLIESDFTPIDQNMTLGDMVKIVAVSNRNIFPVVDKKNDIVGVVTLDDIRSDMFDKDLYEKNKVLFYMSKPPEVISINDSISMVLTKFDKSGAWNLPVVGNESGYMGFVSKSKIFSEYRNELCKS